MLFSIAVFFIGLLNCALSDVWLDRVDPRLLKKFDTPTSTVSYLILLNSEPFTTDDVPPLERPAYVYNRLSAEAARTQAPFIEYLKKAEVPYKSYIVTNLIVATTNISLLTDIAGMDNVKIIEPNNEFRVALEEPEIIEIPAGNDTLKRQTATIEWNVDWVRAPTVWNTVRDPNNNPVNGRGFVVANADTGVQWDHPALRAAYRGAQSGTVNHNYNWWDSVRSGGGRCGPNTKAPCDDNGHGTHTTGTAVGYTTAGNGNYIGVAPGATWIACRNMNAGLGTPTTYIECLDFFISPYDLNGNNRRPDLAPHVIGNSYGCPPSEGCNTQSLSQAVANVIRAGIFMSVSAGNSGPSCSSISDPPATDLGVCSVGATGQRVSTIASFSSRGPIARGGSSVIGPSIVAPGSGVRSAYPTNTYATLSGTSMASPAVTGAVPLLWQAVPTLSRDVAKTLDIFKISATPRASTACSSPSTGPNNVFGNGELNVYNAIEVAKSP
jgi:subtilisin family serine protease